MPITTRVVATIFVALTTLVATLRADAQIKLPKIPDLRKLPEKIGTQAASDALLWAAAKTLGIKDPITERRLTPDEQRSAATARQVFERAYDVARSATYDPTDQARADEQVARVRGVAERLKRRKVVTRADLQDSATALLPFLRYAIAARGDSGNRAVILPGQARRVTFQTYCMDLGVPAPRSDENIHLVNRGRLIPPHGAALYAALMEYSAAHPDAHGAVQNLVWGMRHARAQAPFLKELAPEQAMLLNATTPDGASQFRQYLAKEMVSGRIDEIKWKIYQRAVSSVERAIGKPLPPPSGVGYSVSDVNTALRYLEQALVTEGDFTVDSDYTLLAPGVAARSVSGTIGIHTTQFDVVNDSCEPYTLDGDTLVGQSTRVTQRLALGGIVQPSLTQAVAAPVAAFGRDMFQRLERRLYPAADDKISAAIAEALRMALPVLQTGANAMPPTVGLGPAIHFLSDGPACDLDVCDTAQRIENLPASRADKKRLQELTRELLGALTVLHGYRDAFLREGRPINVFPDAYYHVTAIELQRIANGEFHQPIPKMEQLLAFFSAYQSNRLAWDRGGSGVDEHWQKHFSELQGSGLAAIDYAHALRTGITAHVDFDLPRALRATVKFPATAQLRDEFLMTNDTLRAANEPSLNDWLAVGSGDLPVGIFAWLGKHSDSETEDVIGRRENAWNIASDGSRALPTKDVPQPVTDHDGLRRAWNAACGH